MSSGSNKGTVAKILVIGDVATGKTSLIQRYVYKTFEPNRNATLGVDFAMKRVHVDDSMLNVQLWDIAGQERFIGLAPTYYRHAVAAIVVFDITTRNTLENAKKWKEDVDDKVFLRNGDNIPAVLVANKWDLIDENPDIRQISDNELDTFCHENKFVGWFTISAKTGLNVKKAMNFIITKICKNNRKLQRENIEAEEEKYIDLDRRQHDEMNNGARGCCFNTGNKQINNRMRQNNDEEEKKYDDKEIENMNELNDEKKDDDGTIHRIRFEDWLLNTVHMKQYIKLFENNQSNDIRMIEFLNEEILKNDIGIENVLHRKLIMKKVNEFKELQHEFNVWLNNNRSVKPYKDEFEQHGILILKDLQKYVTTKQKLSEIINIVNENELNFVWNVVSSANSNHVMQPKIEEGQMTEYL